MKKDIRISKATQGDFLYLIDAIQRYFHYDGIHFDSEKVPVSLMQLLGDERLGAAWVFRSDSHVIGYAIVGFGFDLEFGGRQATLTDLFIEPEYRKQGIGKAFLMHLETYCLAEELGAIELQVELDNPEALALYESQGFVRHTRIPMSKRLKA